jgi:hypothetical protein
MPGKQLLLHTVKPKVRRSEPMGISRSRSGTEAKVRTNTKQCKGSVTPNEVRNLPGSSGCSKYSEALKNVVSGPMIPHFVRNSMGDVIVHGYCRPLLQIYRGRPAYCKSNYGARGEGCLDVAGTTSGKVGANGWLVTGWAKDRAEGRDSSLRSE